MVTLHAQIFTLRSKCDSEMMMMNLIHSTNLLAWVKHELTFNNTANKRAKGQPGALKLPHTQGPGRGPTIWCIVRSLTLFFTQEAVSRTWTHDLPVTWQQLYQLRQGYPSNNTPNTRLNLVYTKYIIFLILILELPIMDSSLFPILSFC